MAFKKNGTVTTSQINESFSNIYKIGSPNISSDLVASGFTPANYLSTSQFDLSTNNWELDFTFTTGTLSGTNHYPILVGSDTGKAIFGFSIDNGSGFNFCISSDGINWNVSTNARTSVSYAANTTYNVRICFNGTAYTVYINGTLAYTVTSSLKLYQANAVTFYFGVHRNKSSAFNGTIDLSKFLLKIDNNIVYSVAGGNVSISNYQTTTTNLIEI